jgi:hypothetical protein
MHKNINGKYVAQSERKPELCVDRLDWTNLLSQVYIFSVHVATSTDDEHRIEIIHELEGEEVGEYFGAAVCVLDVNGDGLDDLLVGAPHYGHKRKWDQGRIVVYLTTVSCI